MTQDRIVVIAGKHDNIAELIEPVYEELTGKQLDPKVHNCYATNIGKLEFGSEVYCQYKEDECPYQKEFDRELPYCEKR